MGHYLTLNQDSLEKFRIRFARTGFEEIFPVRITSGYDSSTFLIGSTISVLKPFLQSIGAIDGGLFLVQDVVRTHPLSLHGAISSPLKYGSFWTSCGALAPPNQLCVLLSTSIQYVNHDLGIPSSDIVARASSRDDILLSALKELDCDIKTEIDTENSDYYRHSFGLRGVWGQNVNLAVRIRGTDEFIEFASVILINQGANALAVEVSLSPSALWSFWLGFNNTYAAAPIADYISLHSEHMLRIADCLCVIGVLDLEGVKPSSSNISGRLIRQYLRSLQRLYRSRSEIGVSCIESAYRCFGLEYFKAELALNPLLKRTQSQNVQSK